ncbi:S8 family serine peptidase [Micromonospora sp. NPDC048999]|uniref:S8 family serine peptidase n=1 Tax=Micromonospora sp. NPDC048999 TaxID=3155391 RepID=UPI0033C03CE6
MEIPPAATPVPARREPGPWPVVAAVLVGGWAVLVTVSSQVVGWAVDQLVLVEGLHRAVWMWPVVALATVLLVGAPSLGLALLPRAPAVRATGRAWLGATLVLGALTLLRTVPPVHKEAYLAALAATAAALTLLVGRLSRPRRDAETPATSGELLPREADRQQVPRSSADLGRPRLGPVALLAIAAGLASLVPWAWVGALGGALETLLAGLAAAALGALAGALLDAPFWARFAVGAPPRPARLVLVGGLVAGVTLVPLAGAAGQSGAQLPALVLLPPLGFVLGALEAAARRSGRSAGRAPARWLVGLALAGPLAFADPEEITVLLTGSRDVPYWVAVGSGAAFAVAVLLAIAYGVLLARPRAGSPRRGAAGLTAAALLAAVAVVYVVPGHPGLYGERLLVVLREQADLTGLPTGAAGREGRNVRAAEVYRRLVATADRTQGDLRRKLTRLHLHPTPYYLVNAIETDGGPGVRAWLSARPEVARVLISQRLRPLPAMAPPARGSQPAPTGPVWNVSLIGADRVWSELGVTGSGIVVGTSDSGVDGRHPALAAGFRGGDDSWYDPWEHRRTPGDRDGHGTHTIGSAVGRNGIGVAPGAQWVGCVNLDRNLGSPAHYLDCLQFMLAPFPAGGNPFTDGRPDRAPDVLTNSWGCPPIEGCDPGALRPATAALAAAGILLVVAAGNSGPHCGSVTDPPAPYADVLTVGAVDRARQLTGFSSRGPAAGGLAKPDLVAPGAGVLSAFPGGGYATLDGTSMATPQVAGVVALMWSANPALIGDLARTRQIILDTATSAGTPPGTEQCGGTQNLTGAGLVDADAAVRAAMKAGAPS